MLQFCVEFPLSAVSGDVGSVFSQDEGEEITLYSSPQDDVSLLQWDAWSVGGSTCNTRTRTSKVTSVGVGL